MNSAIFPLIPFDTTAAARSVFGKSNFYLVTGDQANQLFEGLNLDEAVEKLQMSPQAVAMLYMITIFQFIENLPDLGAKDALRERIDWKYALHLSLDYSDPETGPLCEFRKWLLSDQAKLQQFQLLLRRLSEVTDFTGKQSYNLEAGQVIGEVCVVSRLAMVWEALTKALEALETSHPKWLSIAGLPHWYERYTNPQQAINLGTGRLKKHSWIHMIGADGFYLLKAISESGIPGLADLPEVLKLETVWQEQYERVDERVVWRREACESCSSDSKLLQSIQNSIHKMNK